MLQGGTLTKQPLWSPKLHLPGLVGIAFTAQDESDQAMAAYRTASRLFPGSHVPLFALGWSMLNEQFEVS